MKHNSTLNTILLWLPIIYGILYTKHGRTAVKCCRFWLAKCFMHTISNWYACNVVNGFFWEHVPDWNISINPRMKCIPDGSPIFSLYLSLMQVCTINKTRFFFLFVSIYGNKNEIKFLQLAQHIFLLVVCVSITLQLHICNLAVYSARTIFLFFLSFIAKNNFYLCMLMSFRNIAFFFLVSFSQ